jgi:hypothetical protein
LILIEAAPLVNNHSSRSFLLHHPGLRPNASIVQAVPNFTELLARLLPAERLVSLST